LTITFLGLLLAVNQVAMHEGLLCVLKGGLRTFVPITRQPAGKD
jgi:hypothetical protein